MAWCTFCLKQQLKKENIFFIGTHSSIKISFAQDRLRLPCIPLSLPHHGNYDRPWVNWWQHNDIITQWPYVGSDSIQVSLQSATPFLFLNCAVCICLQFLWSKWFIIKSIHHDSYLVSETEKLTSHQSWAGSSLLVHCTMLWKRDI